MTARKDTPPTRYTQCEAYRQAVLDIVHKTPGITGSAIIRHFEWPEGTANSRLVNMCEMLEMSREEVWIEVTDVKGRRKKVRTYTYTALVLKTVTAESVRRRAEGYEARPGKKKAKSAAPAKKKKGPTWLTSNTKADRKPIRNPDAQHSGMPRVFVGGMA